MQSVGVSLGESRERQLRELEARMGLMSGVFRQQDVDEELDYGDMEADVSSASVPSFTA